MAFDLERLLTRAENPVLEAGSCVPLCDHHLLTLLVQGSCSRVYGDRQGQTPQHLPCGSGLSWADCGGAGLPQKAALSAQKAGLSGLGTWF